MAMNKVNISVRAIKTVIVSTIFLALNLLFITSAFAAMDTDGDGVIDSSDNCTLVPNQLQRDTDYDGYGNYCDPDFDGNLVVNAGDLAYLKLKFFTPDPIADLNGDGVAASADLAILKSMFFQSPGPSYLDGGITIGTQVGQQSPDFSLFDTLGNSRGLYDELSKSTGVVLYFTMWSPINDLHASHMRAEIMPIFPDVSFFLVDYVSGSVLLSRDAQLSNGYADIETLVDIDQTVFNLYQASMGATVVIDNAGIVRMNEYYEDGTKLIDVLTTLN